MNDRNRLRTLGPSPASLPSLSFSLSFFFLFLFVSYSDLSASSIPGPVLPPLCARKKHSFIPSPHHRPLPPPASLTYAACLSLNFTLSPSWSWQVVDSIMRTSLHSFTVFATELAVNRAHVPFSKGKIDFFICETIYISIKKFYYCLTADILILINLKQIRSSDFTQHLDGNTGGRNNVVIS